MVVGQAVDVAIVAFGELHDLQLRQQELGQRDRQRVASSRSAIGIEWHIEKSPTKTSSLRSLRIVEEQAARPVERVEHLVGRRSPRTQQVGQGRASLPA